MIEAIENDILPNALMIGVDYDLFWTLNPKSLFPFTKAFSLKREYDDYKLWTAGLYIRSAVASVLNKSAKYPQKPIGVSSNNECDMKTIKERFLRQANKINIQFRKENN